MFGHFHFRRICARDSEPMPNRKFSPNQTIRKARIPVGRAIVYPKISLQNDLEVFEIDYNKHKGFWQYKSDRKKYCMLSAEC